MPRLALAAFLIGAGGFPALAQDLSACEDPTLSAREVLAQCRPATRSGEAFDEREDPASLHQLSMAVVRRAEALITVGRAYDALRELDQVLDRFPQHPQAHQMAAEAHLFMLEFTEVPRHLAFARMAQDRETLLRGRYAQARLWAAQVDLDRAMQEFVDVLGEARALGAADLIARVLTQIGFLQIDQGMPDAANRTFAEALSLNPRSPDAILGVGLAFKRMGQWPEALNAYEIARVYAEDYDPRPDQWTAWLLLEEGTGLRDPERAVQLARRAFNTYKTEADFEASLIYADLAFVLASAQTAVGAYDDAVESFETSMLFSRLYHRSYARDLTDQRLYLGNLALHRPDHVLDAIRACLPEGCVLTGPQWCRTGADMPCRPIHR